VGAVLTNLNTAELLEASNKLLASHGTILSPIHKSVKSL
jgi:hypothetical protein